MAIPFVYEERVSYGAATQVSPLVRRVMADNPSNFTYHGTGTYIIGRGEVAVIDAGPAMSTRSWPPRQAKPSPIS